MADIIGRLIKEFALKPEQVKNTVNLIDEGNTIPFIARYRKEMTGELSDVVLRDLHERLVYLRNLEARREDVRRLIEEQGKLTEEISKALDVAKSLQEIEDIYRPFKPKRKTRASVAKEKGLEPLAIIIMEQDPKLANIMEVALEFVNLEKGVKNEQEALAGAMDIIAEDISDNAKFRKAIRDMFFEHGTIVSTTKKDEDSVYRMYYDFKEPVSKIPGHRILAINRGESEEFLAIKIVVPDERMTDYLLVQNLKPNKAVTREFVEKAVLDSYSRLISQSIEREIRNELTETAEEKAMKVFSDNLKNLLLQPPLKGRVVLGLDPAYRTGCKLAVVDETGKVLDTAVIFPTPPMSKIEESKKVVKHFIQKHNIDIISIGNGTASKESEIFVVELLKEIPKKIVYMVVSEAGASVYSASKIGSDEFPDFDPAQRSAVSIARRLQDPLAELVKIDPKAIGVGQYQHDMNQKKLGENLGGVVEDCVNSVGVDLNTASAPLLSYISGINSSIAKSIVEHREKSGKFKNRKELMKVKKLGEKAFEQAAGFLRINDAENVLDNTSVHPESYTAALKLLEIAKYSLADVKEKNIFALELKISQMGFEKVAQQVGVGVPTLKDMVKELLKPGRDPRDELPQPMLLTDVMDIADLIPGMTITGTVRNVADFGAFVDVGVHQDGLVHVSELSDKYIKNPMEVVSVGNIVKVTVLSVDVARKRISLTMKGVNQSQI